MERAKITASAPILLVADVQKASAYYRDRLGFRIEQSYGEPASFAILSRNDFQLFLSGVEEPRHIVPNHKVVQNMWNLYFWVDDIQALFSEFQTNGAIIDYEIENKGNGVLEFGIQDLDGYEIAFAEIRSGK
jgi:catechol 2,3-dioxygenase-like lactoylglutathione lyase family enzyme